MPEELKLPEGKIIRKSRGGPDFLKGLLVDLRKYAFSGYLKTTLRETKTQSTGIIILKGGNPEAAMHVQGVVESLGKVAFRRVWEDSSKELSLIEVHAKVDVDALLSKHPEARIDRERRPAETAIPLLAEEKLAMEERLASWKVKDYDVSILERMLEDQSQGVKESFDEFNQSVKTVEVLGGILNSLDVKGFEKEAEQLRERLKDPTKHMALEADLQELQEKIEKKREEMAAPSIDEKREREITERARQVFEMIVKHRAAAGRPIEDLTETKVREAIESKSVTTRDVTTNLISQYNFDSFVVGSSNRFANAAAMAVAKSLHEAYNPLFITSGPGLGKTHLLNAIGNYVHEKTPNAKILYLSTESFANEFKEAPRQNKLSEFREKFRNLDLLLIDDIHFLSGKIDVQEELFHTFNALYNSNKQIALTSDRPPKEIPDLEERLVSRFESGLIADIQPPDFETRFAILKKRVQDAGVEVENDVLTYISHIVESNIRELGGALNRVVAFSALMGQKVSLSLAKEVLKDLTPERGERRRRPSLDQVIRELNPGRSYLIEEEKPVNVFRLLSKYTEGKGNGLIITRSNPKRIRERYNLKTERILWLTDRESTTEETMPPTLERLIYSIEEFIRASGKGAVMLDGIEYLISNNSFEAVLRFIRRLVDHISESQFVMLLSLSPKTMKEQEVKIVEREMEVVMF